MSDNKDFNEALYYQVKEHYYDVFKNRDVIDSRASILLLFISLLISATALIAEKELIQLSYYVKLLLSIALGLVIAALSIFGVFFNTYRKRSRYLYLPYDTLDNVKDEEHKGGHGKKKTNKNKQATIKEVIDSFSKEETGDPSKYYKRMYEALGRCSVLNIEKNARKNGYFRVLTALLILAGDILIGSIILMLWIS